MIKNPWTGIYILSLLTGIVFIFLIASLFPNSNIEFTNLPGAEKNEPTILATDPVLGSLTKGFGFWKSADTEKVLIIYYGNHTCDSCAQTTQALLNVYQAYPNDVAIVWKDFPNPTIKIESLNSAIAARCADKQNRFWEFTNYLVDNHRNASAELYQEIANELDLGMWRFQSCYNNQKTMDLVEEGFDEAVDFGLTASPTIWINGNWYSGELSESEIEALISAVKSLQN